MSDEWLYVHWRGGIWKAFQRIGGVDMRWVKGPRPDKGIWQRLATSQYLWQCEELTPLEILGLMGDAEAIP